MFFIHKEQLEAELFTLDRENNRKIYKKQVFVYTWICELHKRNLSEILFSTGKSPF